jgi:hypothetical protein
MTPRNKPDNDFDDETVLAYAAAVIALVALAGAAIFLPMVF